MKLFNVTPYLLLLEQENSNEETLSKANAEFVKEVYELQRAENDITIVLFQLQYLSCRLVILREHYRTAQKEHLICYSYIIGTLTYLEGMQAHCKFAYEIHPAGADVSTVPAGTPPVIFFLFAPVFWRVVEFGQQTFNDNADGTKMVFHFMSDRSCQKSE